MTNEQERLDPLEMLLDAAQFIRREKPDWARAARAAVARARASAPHADVRAVAHISTDAAIKAISAFVRTDDARKIVAKIAAVEATEARAALARPQEGAEVMRTARRDLGICLDCGVNDGDDHADHCSVSRPHHSTTEK